MAYETKPYVPGKSSTSFPQRKKSGGGFGKKDPVERAGIAVSVALNNIFGNLTLDELLSLSGGKGELYKLLKLSDTLIDYQVKKIAEVKVSMESGS